MKVIDLEQHFETPLWIEALKNNPGYPRFDEEKAWVTGKTRGFRTPRPVRMKSFWIWGRTASA